jgi:hypothetical protein
MVKTNGHIEILIVGGDFHSFRILHGWGDIGPHRGQLHVESSHSW